MEDYLHAINGHLQAWLRQHTEAPARLIYPLREGNWQEYSGDIARCAACLVVRWRCWTLASPVDDEAAAQLAPATAADLVAVFGEHYVEWFEFLRKEFECVSSILAADTCAVGRIEQAFAPSSRALTDALAGPDMPLMTIEIRAKAVDFVNDWSDTGSVAVLLTERLAFATMGSQHFTRFALQRAVREVTLSGTVAGAEVSRWRSGLEAADA